MTANASMPDPENHDRAFRARLNNEPLPGAIIDCATAEVLAANVGGLDALGLTAADRLPTTLDSAMPAIAVLRELHRSGLGAPTRKTLVFWRLGRTSARLCEIGVTGSATDTHLIVQFCTEAHAACDNGPIPPPGPTRAANDDTPPRIAGDVGGALKGIARRLRQGQGPLANADDDTGPANIPPFSAPDTAAALNATPASRNQPPERSSPSPTRDILRTLPLEDIAKLAHELKTPLTAIAAAAEIMRDQSLGTMGNDKYLGYAADIHDSATHALAVIGAMLSAVPSNGDQQSGGEAFDLTDLAEKAVSALQPLAQQHSLSLSLDAGYSLMPVRANATAIRQILLNLLTNALKFTPPAGDVRVITGTLADGAIFFAVRDTGEGMSEDAIAHAIDTGPESLAARPGGGRGIGLRLVRRLAAENGCAFEIDSALGQGTVVLIAFPKDLVGQR